MRIVLLGAPGSGKRTQTKLIVEKYGIPAICTGELLKNAVTQGSTLGVQVKAALDAGRSVSEEVVLELIHDRLIKSDAQNGFVLDGFPRNILQAITLDELLIEIGQPLELALLIDIETDALMERLVGRRTCKSCGAHYNIYINPTAVEGVCDLCGGHLRHRADDNEETVSSRLHIYDHLVSPLLKHYSKQQKLKQVEGFGEIDQVFTRICQSIDTHEPPVKAALADAEPVVVTMETTDLQPVREEDPVKQLIPTGLEPPERKPESSGQKAAKTKKKAASSQKTGKGKVKPKARTASVKKPAAADKTPAKKKIAQKKKTAAVKKALAKKKTAGKKPLAGHKKPVAKKKAAVKKGAVIKNTTSRKNTKKTTAKKAIAQKKGPVAKKKVSSLTKKKSANKKTVTGKKTPAKKKPMKKKHLK